jgi:hypothetical protein
VGNGHQVPSQPLTLENLIMLLASLKTRIARAAGAIPRTLPRSADASEVVELLFAEGLVLAALEKWASARPDYQPMGPPSIPYFPTAADIHLAKQCSQLAALGQPHLVHDAAEHDQRIEKLFALYQASGESCESIETALTEVGTALAAFLDSGKRIPAWAANRAVLASSTTKGTP